jgi:hypothetical protein
MNVVDRNDYVTHNQVLNLAAELEPQNLARTFHGYQASQESLHLYGA